MRLFRVIALFVLPVSTLVLGQEYGLNGLDQSLFKDYRVPEIRYRSLYFNAGLNYYSNSYQYKSESADRVNENYKLNFRPRYNYSDESEDMVLNLYALMGMSIGSDYSETDENEWTAGSKAHH
ncbi:MAG: hypothetical protein JW995_11685 [Melioribacteraceae bacterium]|nr:hypothetical protein [Melioribacteraceae bacterium]